MVEKLSAGYDALLRDWKTTIEQSVSSATPHHNHPPSSPVEATCMVPIELLVQGLDVDSPALNTGADVQSSSSSSLSDIGRVTTTEGAVISTVLLIFFLLLFTLFYSSYSCH